MSFYWLDQPGDISPNVLGNKGHGLMQMHREGLPVPAAVILPVEMSKQYLQGGLHADLTLHHLAGMLPAIIDYFKQKCGEMPLVSVRSGAPISMPGMMDTKLNVKVDGILPAVEEVFKSWNSERAVYYRNERGIPHDLGTAVVIQAMVFGDKDEQSGTGVAFSRNPDTGEKKVTGEFLIKAQGEALVSGAVTPKPLSDMAGWNGKVFAQLCKMLKKLEGLKGYPVEVEFTVQSGVLYLLQVRAAKLSARASIKIAVDQHAEGMPAKQALACVSLRAYHESTGVAIKPKIKRPIPLGTGMCACAGVGQGVVVTSAHEALHSKVPCVLVTDETRPEDIAGMDKAVAVVTMKGGITCHAAVVARGRNKPCVVGVGKEVWDFPSGQMVTVDAERGAIYPGELPLVTASTDLADFHRLLVEASGGVRWIPIPVWELSVIGVEAMAEKLAKEVRRCKAPYMLYFEHSDPGYCPMLGVSPDEVLSGKELGKAMTEVLTLEELKLMVPTRIYHSLQSMIMATHSGYWEFDKYTDENDLEAIVKVIEWKAAEGVTLQSIAKAEPQTLGTALTTLCAG